MCGETGCLWVSLFKTSGSSTGGHEAKKNSPDGIQGVLSITRVCSYRQRVVIRKPTIATPKPTRILPAPSAGTG